MEKRYTIGVMIGNANSPHTMNLMQGIFHAARVYGRKCSVFSWDSQ